MPGGDMVRVHPVNPEPRLLARAAEVVRKGGVIAYPTDSIYALGCRLEDKAAAERLRRLRGAERNHPFTLMCRDLSEIATYAHVSNSAYRLLKSLTPGPYTFVLPATREVPRRLMHPKRKQIGIRVPDNRVAHDLLRQLDQPLMSATVVLSNDYATLADADAVALAYGHQLDLILDGGPSPGEPTTVLKLDEGRIEVLRRGRGKVGDWAEQASV
ncbi:MAG TPA: L-threonylcarbamoyladenylate synthase [Gammaproteobacteria bacterium]|nr:L-threonylcarbamoyladenylate synthase [Gammaproteobacteria bacterium]